MNLTPEQLAILDTNHDLVINAVAGSGKTTTLIEYARTRPAGSSILYLAFNKTVKTEAIQKFTAAGVKNVKVETAHSLAFDRIVKGSNYKIIQGYKSYEWCEMLDINTGDKLADYVLANHVSKFISYFCNNKAAKVQDLNYREVISEPKAKTFVDNFYKHIESFTRKALAMMEKGEIEVTHDFYLKKFQLSNPVLNYDYILFDEGQDASPAMLDIFLKQNAIRIIVGDRHQQIYGWRFAINSLEQVDFPVFNLSNSFRFDDEIALVANKILDWKQHLNQSIPVRVLGAGKPAELINSQATLGRTNVSLLVNAIAQWQSGNIQHVYFEGNINSYTFADEGASLYDVLNLYLGKKEKIKDKLIASMKSIGELEDYIKKTEDNSLSMILEVVKQFGAKLPNLINELKTNHTTTKEEADMIFSTVHRCKGMEYDEVTLLDDFMNEEKLKRLILEAGGEKMNLVDRNRLVEEVNVLYVAATRAKSRLSLPESINPLRSIKTSVAPQIQLYSGYRSSVKDDWEDIGYRSFTRRSYSKSSNHGKSWSIEDTTLLQQLYLKKTTIGDIARQLGRGESGVKYKLQQLGLIDPEAAFDLPF